MYDLIISFVNSREKWWGDIHSTCTRASGQEAGGICPPHGAWEGQRLC